MVVGWEWVQIPQGGNMSEVVGGQMDHPEAPPSIVEPGSAGDAAVRVAPGLETLSLEAAKVREHSAMIQK